MKNRTINRIIDILNNCDQTTLEAIRAALEAIVTGGRHGRIKN